jgi:hypothetical protein
VGVLGVKAIVGVLAGVVGVAVNLATVGAAVGGGSTGEQPVKRMITRDRAGQIFITNCQ